MTSNRLNSKKRPFSRFSIGKIAQRISFFMAAVSIFGVLSLAASAGSSAMQFGLKLPYIC
jgi:hypothetical protein